MPQINSKQWRESRAMRIKRDTPMSDEPEDQDDEIVAADEPEPQAQCQIDRTDEQS